MRLDRFLRNWPLEVRIEKNSPVIINDCECRSRGVCDLSGCCNNSVSGLESLESNGA